MTNNAEEPIQGAKKNKPIMHGKVPMPPWYIKLITVGVVYPQEMDPPMKCAFCDLLVGMVFKHDTINLATYKGTLPGAMWGRDVDVICPCCSFPSKSGCTHRRIQPEN